MLFLVMIVKCNSMAWRMNSIVTELQSVQLLLILNHQIFVIVFI